MSRAAALLIGLGFVLVAASPTLKSELRVGWFWSAEDRVRRAVAAAHYERLYLAMHAEQKRRRLYGEPLLTERPEAVRRAQARAAEANQPVLVARKRPAQIAAVARYTGIGAMFCGLACLAAGRLGISTDRADASHDIESRGDGPAS